MDNLIWAILPIVLLVAMYVFIFTRKGEIKRARVNLRRNDWITNITAIFGAVLLASALSTADIRLPNAPWLLTLLLAVFFILIVRKARTGKPIMKIEGDERMEMVGAKSARNALFATYLALFLRAFFTDADTLDANWMVILLASGLAVLLASMLFYYYKGD